MGENNVWVYIEVFDGKPATVSLELLGKGRQLADDRQTRLIAVLVGKGVRGLAQKMIAYGADTVIVVDQAELTAYNAETYAVVMALLLKKYSPNVLLIGATHNGRDMGGRLSAKMELGLVADCTDCHYKEDTNTIEWVRPAYTGKLMVEIEVTTQPQLATIGEHIFCDNRYDVSRTGSIIEERLDLTDIMVQQRVIDFTVVPEEERELTLDNAAIIVGAGRGVKTQEGMYQVAAFAKSIGAAFGVSKPLVDNGWISHDFQIGVTGKKIHPKIYIALGISGAIQHALGIKDAELVIAVNTDPDANIFKLAHYGIVGDMFKTMPALEEALKALKK